MAESATKGLGLNDRDATIRKFGCSGVTEISVEGFETCSLQEYAMKLTLRKHFASCGKVLTVSVIKKRTPRISSPALAFIRIDGEDAQEKALALNGTDVGGWYAIVKAEQFQCGPFVDPSMRIKEYSFSVEGYDIGLPKIDIQIALCKHFSSCGEVTKVNVLPNGVSYINIEGQSGLHKALELSGRDMGGMNLVVDANLLRTEPFKRPYTSYRPTGYMPPPHKHEMYKKLGKEIMEKEEIEKEMKKMKVTEKKAA